MPVAIAIIAVSATNQGVRAAHRRVTRAYHEGDDFHYRAKLIGIPTSEVNLPSEHFGSATVHCDDQINELNQRASPLNQRRYVVKWGGLPEHETFVVPWHGETPIPSVQELVDRQR